MRTAPMLALVSTAVFAVSVPLRVAKAQDQSFRVAKTGGTPDEKPQIDAAVARLRAKFGDAAFEKRVNDALAKRDFPTVKSIIATTAQVPAEAVVIGLPAKTSRLEPPRDSYFRLASSALNPWYAVIITKSTAYCVGLFAGGADECRAALTKLGYTPTN
jgi:hypothetical protein